MRGVTLVAIKYHRDSIATIMVSHQAQERLEVLRALLASDQEQAMPGCQIHAAKHHALGMVPLQ